MDSVPITDTHKIKQFPNNGHISAGIAKPCSLFLL